MKSVQKRARSMFTGRDKCQGHYSVLLYFQLPQQVPLIRLCPYKSRVRKMMVRQREGHFTQQSVLRIPFCGHFMSFRSNSVLHVMLTSKEDGQGIKLARANPNGKQGQHCSGTLPDTLLDRGKTTSLTMALLIICHSLTRTMFDLQ